MKTPLLDCPLCDVTMNQALGNLFICPVCNSMFAPYLGGANPRSRTLRRKARFVQQRLAALTPS